MKLFRTSRVALYIFCFSFFFFQLSKCDQLQVLPGGQSSSMFYNTWQSKYFIAPISLVSWAYLYHFCSCWIGQLHLHIHDHWSCYHSIIILFFKAKFTVHMICWNFINFYIKHLTLNLSLPLQVLKNQLRYRWLVFKFLKNSKKYNNINHSQKLELQLIINIIDKIKTWKGPYSFTKNLL